MAPRASWKGALRIGDLSCAVALYTATSTSDRVSFHTINRATGNRVRREFVDSETGKPVAREDQVKGYELASGEFVVLQPEEIAAALPSGDKVLEVTGFLSNAEIDELYLDSPYYLAPADKASEEAFILIREGLARRKVAAFAEAVLFRKARNLLIRPEGAGLVATTLSYDYEIRSAEEAFEGITERKISPEMIDLAKHIIDTKMGSFDIAAFDDRYDAALAELVKAKIEGKPYRAKRAPEPEKVVDLMAALRASAKASGKAAPKKAASAARKTKSAETGAKTRKRA